MAKRGEEKANGFVADYMLQLMGFLLSNLCHILQYAFITRSVFWGVFMESRFPSSHCLHLGSSEFLSVPKHACFPPAAFVLDGR